MTLNLYPGELSAPMPPSSESGAAELETVELMLALEAQDVRLSGFEECVRAAVRSVNGELLFHLPAPASLPFQRVALVMLATENGPAIVLATLDETGSAIDIQPETGETEHLFRLGEAYLNVATRFRM
jgi:hypothetical protein